MKKLKMQIDVWGFKIDIFIAILLYHLGVKPMSTMFIDGNTISWGYGEMCEHTGTWKYQIPLGYKEKTEIIVKKIEVDFHEIYWSGEEAHNVEIIHWTRHFPNKFLYWLDRKLNPSDYEEQLNVATVGTPVYIKIKEVKNEI